jgi:hypothetical protein
MIKYSITFYCKNKNSFKNFLKILKLNLDTQKFQLPFKYNKKNKKTKKITILKSPHVNKTAQEQFELNKYSVTIDIYSYKIKKYLLLFKKIKYQTFPDIEIKVTGINTKTNNNKNLIFFNPINYKFNLDKLNFVKQMLKHKNLKNYKKINSYYFNKKLLTKTKNYLQLLEFYGN